MNPKLNQKSFVEALFDVMNVGVFRDQLEDAECVLNAIRALRPAVREFDTFEANIAMRRGQWRHAIYILRNVEAASPNWLPGKAALMQCLHAIGDPAWRVTGNEILEQAPISDEADMVRVAMGLPVELPAESDTPPAEVEASPASAVPMSYTFYVRA